MIKLYSYGGNRGDEFFIKTKKREDRQKIVNMCELLNLDPAQRYWAADKETFLEGCGTIWYIWDKQTVDKLVEFGVCEYAKN